MHMLVASDGGGGEMHPYASVPAEQELELHRDNAADDSLDGHVRYVRAQVLPLSVACSPLVMLLIGEMVLPLAVFLFDADETVTVHLFKFSCFCFSCCRSGFSSTVCLHLSSS